MFVVRFGCCLLSLFMGGGRLVDSVFCFAGCVWFGLITYGLNLTFVGVTAWVWWLLPLLSGLRLTFGVGCWRVDLL